MSNANTLASVTELAIQLSPAEQQQLADSLLQRLTSGVEATRSPRRSWREIRGSVPCPLFGEDAQACVTRGRQESEEHREQLGRSSR